MTTSDQNIHHSFQNSNQVLEQLLHLIDWIVTPVLWCFIGIVSIFWCSGAILVNQLFPLSIRKKLNHWAPPLWAESVNWASLSRVRVVHTTGKLPAQPTIYMSNHLSTSDINVLMSVLPSGFKFMSKKENFRIPFIGNVMRILEFISIDRENRREALSSVLEAARRIKDEKLSVWVSPEGTRSTDGTLKPFKRGVFTMALEAKASITPVLLVGTDRLLPRKSAKLHPFSKVDVWVGPTITAHLSSAVEPEELMREVRAAIESLQLNYRALQASVDYPYPLIGSHHYYL